MGIGGGLGSDGIELGSGWGRDWGGMGLGWDWGVIGVGWDRDAGGL